MQGILHTGKLPMVLSYEEMDAMIDKLQLEGVDTLSLGTVELNLMA